MLDIIQAIKKIVNILIKLLPLLSFIIPILLLYSLYPKSFEGDPTWEGTWQGRFFYIFFLWLISLEVILSWENLQTRKASIDRYTFSPRTAAFIIALLLPTIYIVAANYFGVNTVIADLAKQSNIHFWHLIPLAMEYVVFAILFGLMIFLAHGIRGIKDFSISMFFLVAVGVLYVIDDVYPFGRFTPFQIFVQTTTTLGANILNLMGYRTSITVTQDSYYGYIPSLSVRDPTTNLTLANFGIAWPCAGVEGLLIYTITILLFLKKTAIPWWHKMIYFAIGAAITYFINALRIASIFVVAINNGWRWGYMPPEVMRFHNIYGPLYSISWIIAYPLIIIGGRALWGKIRNHKTGTKDHESFEVSSK